MSKLVSSMNNLVNHKVKEVIQYCRSQSIAVFLGEFSDKYLTVVNWNNETDNSWKDFIDSVCFLNKSVPLIIEEEKYFEKNFVDQEVTDWDEPIRSLVNELKSSEGLSYSAKLSVINNDVCYSYKITASWYSQFIEMVSLMIEKEEQEEKIDFHKLTKDEVAEFSKELLVDNTFIRLAQLSQRQNYVMEKYEDEVGANNVRLIISKVEIELESVIRNKVKDLRQQNKSKNEIASELNLSKDRLKKYYY
jgi:hypothetical protein